mgnify:CR=1 FL=1
MTPTCMIGPARYCKKTKMIAVHCQSDGSGFTTSDMRLANTLAGGRYSNRENAWVLSPRRAELFGLLLKRGWCGTIRLNKKDVLKVLDPQGKEHLLKNLKKSDIV